MSEQRPEAPVQGREPERPGEQDYLPEQVRRAAQRAEELQRELTGETPETLEEQQEPQPTTRSDEQLRGATEAQPQPQPQPFTEWEQRYRTLQGKYDSETNSMRGQISAMERLLATMQTPPAQQQPQAQSQPLPPSGEYDPADLELYGQDMLDAAGRVADARYARQMAEMRAEINQLRGHQVQGQAQIVQDRVFRELDGDSELAGRWRRINESPQFIEWLQGVDEYSGLSRNEMIQHAYTNGDAMRTGRFFKKFMAEHTAPPSMPTTASQTGNGLAHYQPSGGSGNGSTPAGGPRLEDMAAPGRAAGSGTGYGAPQPRIWSRSDIKAFYRDRTSGKFKGREQEAQRLEEDLFMAEAQGRVV